ncbi:ABC transporter ATP-binding protein [Glutamicibacter creatinolyticus]|uniref:amino acid ABC transporter ATP-binding/permease protein n=1 Tax=Glutamicibacter creatinolyticus TaxID=162496 RepID=UPI0034007963
MSTEHHQAPARGQRPHATAGAVRWILASTRDIIAPLLLASVLACLTRLVALAIYYVAGLGLIRASGLALALPGSGAGYGVLAGWLIALALAKGVLRYAEQYVGHKVAFLALARLRTQVYADYERQAPFASGAHSGSMLQRAVRDIDRVEVFFAHTLPPAVAALVTSVLVAVLVGFGVDGPSGLILLGGYLVLGLLVPWLGLGSLRRAAGAEATARARTSRAIGDTLSGAEAVFSLDAQAAMTARLGRACRQPGGVRRASWVRGLRASAVAVVPWLAVLGVAVAGLGRVPGGELILLLVLTVPSFEAVRGVEGFVGSLQESLHSIRTLYANHLAEPPVAEPGAARALGPAGDGLQVQDLSVQRQGRTVLRALDLELGRGERVALVGESGSGKSTLAAVLLRAVDSYGTVLLDGVPIDELTLSDLRTSLVLVAQDDSLVRGTLRENLTLGRTGMTDATLAGVLQELGLGQWFAAQREGLDTRLGERGSRISGGQRQRLVLARALLREPQFLILDEATSALDTHTETLVMQALARRVDAGMGLLMISHKLGVLQDFAEVIVLADGEVIERGSAAALLDRPDSLFARMRRRELASIEDGV